MKSVRLLVRFDPRSHVYDKGRQKDIQGGGVARHLDIQHLANVSLLCRVIMRSAVLEVTWV